MTELLVARGRCWHYVRFKDRNMDLRWCWTLGVMWGGDGVKVGMRVMDQRERKGKESVRLCQARPIRDPECWWMTGSWKIALTV